MNTPEKPLLTRGEARIRRALLLSLAALVAVGIVAGVTWWLLRPATAPVAVEEATIAPIAAPAAPAPDATGARDPTRPPAVTFTDITEAAGIDFVHVNGAYGERLMPETIGSGAAFFDYDQDGDQDLFLVNSMPWPDRPANGPPPTARLYANDGRGRFTDVTAAAGLAITTYGMGVAIGDYDGDGWEDLYLTTLHRNRLFRNDRGRFVEVTDESGTGGGADTWSSSAAFVDTDRDGDLDLFVVNYVKWSRAIDLEIDFRLTGLGRAYGAPLNFIGTQNQLFRNNGDGSFTDISAAAGLLVSDPVSGNPVGKGLGIVPVDINGDGWQDVVVVNDTVRNFLYMNRGDGTFTETAIFDGIAYDRNGKATSAMGVDAAWFRDDQELGIAVGNFANEMASLFVSTSGQAPFVDEAVLEGIGPASRIPLTFGLMFFDYDLDGREDLLLANGHLEHEIHRVQQSQHYAQPPSLFWNCGTACGARFVPITAAGDLLADFVGRGIGWADIDGDGDLDVLITQNGRRAVLLRNDQATGHHWLRVALTGRAPNTGALGARLLLTSDPDTPAALTRVREVRPARGYMSSVERPVTFGLGDLADPARLVLTILWPDGSRQQVRPEGVDRTLAIAQP